MLPIMQHVRLVRPLSPRLARRLVCWDSRLSCAADFGFGMSVGNAPTSSLSRSGGGTRLISSTASRTFSSSRPYATVLRSEVERVAGGDGLSTATTMGAGVGAGRLSANQHEQATTVLVSAPKREELDPDEELVEDVEARFQISERAAERLRAIALKENNPNVALRVSVESGGCHGYQTKIDLTNMSEADGDYHFMRPAIAPSNVLVDPTSLSLLSGATLDFATELIGSAFRVTDNPHAVGGCGCGVSWEAKL